MAPVAPFSALGSASDHGSGLRRAGFSIYPAAAGPFARGDPFAAMADNLPFFQVALNLPHAGRIARRILPLLPAETATETPLRKTALSLEALLAPYLELDDNPGGTIALRVRDQAALLGRRLVDQIEREQAGHDRLGQCVRNLFECLELGQEGAAISLRAGENPKSFQRPF